MKNLTILVVFPAALIAAALLPASVTIAALAFATIGGLIRHTRTRRPAGQTKEKGPGVTSTEADNPER